MGRDTSGAREDSRWIFGDHEEDSPMRNMNYALSIFASAISVFCAFPTKTISATLSPITYTQDLTSLVFVPPFGYQSFSGSFTTTSPLGLDAGVSSGFAEYRAQGVSSTSHSDPLLAIHTLAVSAPGFETKAILDWTMSYDFEVVGPDGDIPLIVDAHGFVSGDAFAAYTTTLPGIGISDSNPWNLTETAMAHTNTIYSAKMEVFASSVTDGISTFSAEAFSTVDPRIVISHSIPNYSDYTLVFSNPIGVVPEPGAWATLLVGFGGIGAAMRCLRRRKCSAAAYAA
jgi:hypothetical protein